jgi:PHD/YefM family antitoxin component YafN of YafNO toxin-antitoxin module
MQMTADAIIPITEVSKNFKSACDKTREHGTIFIFKNNRPDIVMMDIDRYQQLISILDDLEHSEIAALVADRKSKDNGKRIPLNEVINA